MRAASRPSLRSVHVSRGLHVFQLCQQLPLLDPVAFFHIKPGNLAESIGADVDVSFWLDLARCADNRSQIHRLRFAGLHRDHALVALMNRNANNRQYENGDAASDRYFLSSAHWSPLSNPMTRRNWPDLIWFLDGMTWLFPTRRFPVQLGTPSDTVLRIQKFQWVKLPCGVSGPNLSD